MDGDYALLCLHQVYYSIFQLGCSLVSLFFPTQARPRALALIKVPPLYRHPLCPRGCREHGFVSSHSFSWELALCAHSFTCSEVSLFDSGLRSSLDSPSTLRFVGSFTLFSLSIPQILNQAQSSKLLQQVFALTIREESGPTIAIRSFTWPAVLSPVVSEGFSQWHYLMQAAHFRILWGQPWASRVHDGTQVPAFLVHS